MTNTPKKIEKMTILEAQVKADITCQLLCGDGSGNKPETHQPMCVYYESEAVNYLLEKEGK